MSDSQYFYSSGINLKINHTPIGSGGEGEVFEVLNSTLSNLVFKRYQEKYRNQEKEKRIQYMIDNPPPKLADNNNHHFIIWPQEIVRDINGFVGFLMPRADGIDLEELCRIGLRPELPIEWNKFNRSSNGSLISRIIVCSNIAKAIDYIHSTGNYIIGDLKPENIKIKPNGLISLFDLDSCQISQNGTVLFSGLMKTPKYSPPEKIDIKNESWDCFIGAIIFYQILCGIHPFSGSLKDKLSGLNTTEQKIQGGFFPFGSKAGAFETIHEAHNTFQKIPLRIQKLFIQSFDEGALKPEKRPRFLNWSLILTEKPKIIEFKIDKEVIISGVSNEINWEVQGAEEVEISYLGKVELKGNRNVKLGASTNIVLNATNEFGTVTKSIFVRVFPTPVLKTLIVPAPDFSSRLELGKINLSRPVIDVSIKLNLNKAEPPSIQQSIETKEFLYGKKGTQSLSSIFQKIKKIIPTLNE